MSRKERRVTQVVRPESDCLVHGRNTCRNRGRVEARDLQVGRYDELYQRGGWTRRRLQLKVTNDAIDPATERQVLLGIGAPAGFLVWRFGDPPR